MSRYMVSDLLRPLSKSFFEDSTIQVARDLLGKYIVHENLVAKIVETEAYLADDPASHSYCGQTKRNLPMFQDSATSYVYFTYGMYHCFNVVTNKKGVGEAVLIRAVEPVRGIEVMKQNRKTMDEKNLTNGPAKLTIALNISRVHNNLNLLDEDSRLRVVQAVKGGRFEVVEAVRVGISKAKESPYRFYIKDNPFVSRK